MGSEKLPVKWDEWGLTLTDFHKSGILRVGSPCVVSCFVHLFLFAGDVLISKFGGQISKSPTKFPIVQY